MFNGAEFNRNVSQHTLEEMEPYFEQYVAWSMDGKQILAHAPTREAALARLRGALEETVVLGVRSNVGFLADLLAERAKLNGKPE